MHSHRTYRLFFVDNFFYEFLRVRLTQTSRLFFVINFFYEFLKVRLTQTNHRNRNITTIQESAIGFLIKYTLLCFFKKFTNERGGSWKTSRRQQITSTITGMTLLTTLGPMETLKWAIQPIVCKVMTRLLWIRQTYSDAEAKTSMVQHRFLLTFQSAIFSAPPNVLLFSLV